MKFIKTRTAWILVTWSFILPLNKREYLLICWISHAFVIYFWWLFWVSIKRLFLIFQNEKNRKAEKVQEFDDEEDEIGPFLWKVSWVEIPDDDDDDEREIEIKDEDAISEEDEEEEEIEDVEEEEEEGMLSLKMISTL